MELRQLKYFAAVADAGSVNGAAKLLNIAQPAISRQIKRLENEIGVSLMRRMPHGVVLTPAGQKVRERATIVLRSVETLQDEIHELTGRKSGQVRFGIPPALGSVLVNGLLDRLRRDAPQVELHLLEGTSDDLEAMLISGNLDLAILSNAEDSRRWNSRVLWTEILYLVVPPGVAFDPSTSGEATIAEVEDLPMILSSRPPSVRRLIESEFVDRGLPLTLVMEVEGPTTVKNLVVQGRGFSILPYASVMADIEAERVSAYPMPELRISRKLAWNAGLEPNVAVRAVGRALENEAQEQIEKFAWVVHGPDSVGRAEW